ncbi:MAG: tRNA (adenosine(37)-N6)-threonylcarbamoyltransferase complex ATPase subunit type 1 TsaE [Candidatus Nealsonbacteria bacterium]|nr:tRNA (adenosine(37)-N6)-threonylcarbamoyltransferase complex ATPase subunit type 1 TsaE [Candidatus Nealsonbacteria bacterium]
MNFSYITCSPKQTRELGMAWAKKIIQRRKGIVLALEGDLGGGKTTFLQGFARGLNIRDRIMSPTFVIVKKFPIPHPSFEFFFHIDCYRIEEEKELISLGVKEILSSPQNIVALEWAERIQNLLPPGTLRVRFKFYNFNKRIITLKNV